MKITSHLCGHESPEISQGKVPEKNMFQTCGKTVTFLTSLVYLHP